MTRPRIRVCRLDDCGLTHRLHFEVDTWEGKSAWFTLPEAFEAAALAEARRLGGDDWTLRTNGCVMEALRLGAIHPARFRSWAQVAEFLTEVRAREARFPAGVGS